MISLTAGRDYVDSMGDLPKLQVLNHLSKIWRVLPIQNYTDEKSGVKISIFAEPGIDKLSARDLVTQGHLLFT